MQKAENFETFLRDTSFRRDRHYENSTRLPPDLAAFACALSALLLLLFES